MEWSSILKSSVNRLLGRKMVMFYIVITVVYFLSISDKLSNDNILIALGWIMTSFIVGNIGEWKYSSKTNSIEVNDNGKN